MRHVTVSWQPEQKHFEASGSHAGRSITINAPHAGPPTGFSAAELLLAGAGACTAWDVVEIMAKKRQPLRALTVEVTGEQDAAPPWTYRRIGLHFRLAGTRLERAAVDRAVELSVKRYCSILATVEATAEVSVDIEIESDPAAEAVGEAAAESEAAEAPAGEGPRA